MSVKTTSSLRQAASVFPADDDCPDNDDSIVGSDLDNSMTEDSNEAPTPGSTIAEQTGHEEVMDTYMETRRPPSSHDRFHNAIERRDSDSVKERPGYGANVESFANEKGWELVDAIRKHQIDTIALLLKRGVDMNFRVIGLPLIFYAVTQKHHAPQIIQLLLDHGANLEETSGPTYVTGEDDINALHWAAGKGMIHAVDFLISKGVKVSGACSNGKTPLIFAAERGHLVVVKLLLAKGAQLHERSANGGSALMWAASHGQYEVVDYLLSQGSGVDDCSQDGLSCLSVASMSGHLAVVELLIKKGANVNTRSVSPKDWTPAIFAAEAGHTEVLQALLSHGADPNVSTGDGDTILELVMERGLLAVAKVLLEAVGGPGYPKDSVALQIATAQSEKTVKSLMNTASIMFRYIDPKHTGSERQDWIQWVLDQGGELVRSQATIHMLHAALAYEDTEITAQLLELGVDPSTVFSTGYTPLTIAVLKHNLKLIEILLEAGADPAQLSRDASDLEFTPLHQAIINWGNYNTKGTSVVKVLLASGRCTVMEGQNAQSSAFARVVRRFDRCDDEVALEATNIVRQMLGSTNVNEDRSEDGSTMMHVAVHYKQKSLVDQLRRAGADIDAKDNDGNTPFLIACRGDVELVNFLATRCADVTAIDNHGHGALHVAAAYGKTDVIEFLLDLNVADEQPLMDLNLCDFAGHTPLIAAILAGHEDAALYLLERGASTSSLTRDKGRSALHYAAEMGMQHVVEKISAQGWSHIIDVQDKKGYTPLALACMAPSPTVVSVLLSPSVIHPANDHSPHRPSANVNIANRITGDSALHIALKRPLHMSRMDDRYSHPALDLLNDECVDVTARDANGRTPLHLAAEFHSVCATKLLLSKGASPHCKDGKGRTPLCLCSNPNIAQVLIDHGANVNHGDENGWTPLHHAVSRCWVKAFAVLSRAGADMEARTRDDGLSVKERLDKFGRWEDWVNLEWQYMCDDAEREKIREFDMRAGYE
ncbi:hypothetical protein ACET3X_009580 [Alternaria dauci]|uniref:Ankyrin n=1 Tax=Alternaria dauci TaxID=48095 RepID=A0ABR3U6H5_9PLEO